ncbi:hypothetical protein QL285_056445 [Trifolium repens]|nr:hypothetical protein QL285_056445 [Trifolium repens]
MKNNEKVPEYISRMILITNEMKACGETLSEQVIIEKVLRSLTPQFDYIVVAIEHSKDLSSMRIEELQSSLEAQELRLTERNSEREVEQQALKAASEKKYQKKSWSEAKNRSDGAQKPETSTSDKQKYQKGKERFDKTKVRCYCCQKLGHFTADCRSNKERESEEANMARSFDDEHVLLMAYESDDDEPVKLTFSDSEEVSEDDYETGVRLYDSESESEVSEDESESEDDSEDEGDSEGSEDEENQGSEGGRTSDNISDARASEGETSGSPTSKEEEEDLEGKSDSESDGGDDSDGASDSDPESSGDSDGGDPDSEDVGSGGQASEFDHAFGGNHDFKGGPSEGGASKGSPASNNGHVSKGETSEGRVSGSIQDSGGQDSEGGASGVGCPASDTVPELEEDCDSGIDYGVNSGVQDSEGASSEVRSSGVQGSEGASSEVRSSEFVTTEEILEKQVWLQAMTEELETLRYDFLGPSGVKTNAELIDSDWSKDKNLRRGQVQNEVLEAAHCSAQKQLADALMKDVKAEHFIHLRDGIGVAEIEFAEYELRNGSRSNSYSEVVRRRNFCGHYSEAVLLRSSRASEVISQKQKKKQKLKEKQKARSKHKLLMRIQKSKSLFNFWVVSLCVNIN